MKCVQFYLDIFSIYREMLHQTRNQNQADDFQSSHTVLRVTSMAECSVDDR